ncbi:hypothetical protein DFH11DRAFT_1874962 [Phellopilus nigrolimitatus]|nr:hypothetical protein DFH11DRAFT_1874962 [Phellopilus nigrolimitatus]
MGADQSRGASAFCEECVVREREQRLQGRAGLSSRQTRSSGASLPSCAVHSRTQRRSTPASELRRASRRPGAQTQTGSAAERVATPFFSVPEAEERATPKARAHYGMTATVTATAHAALKSQTPRPIMRVRVRALLAVASADRLSEPGTRTLSREPSAFFLFLGPRRRARLVPHEDALACAYDFGIQLGVLGKLDSVYDYAVRNRRDGRDNLDSAREERRARRLWNWSLRRKGARTWPRSSLHSKSRLRKGSEGSENENENENTGTAHVARPK